MTSRSKEKMAAAFRKLFRSSGKIRSPEKVPSSSSSKSESPARRLLRHGIHRDQVQPVDVPTDSPSDNRKSGGFFKSKKVSSSPGRVLSEKQSGSGYQQIDAQRLQNNNPLDPPFTVELVNDNLFEWHVRLYRIDAESELAADMRELDIKFILLHIIFPENFPFSPPFMRVISPRIDKGFVMEGGAICMELLTPRGWASAYTVEAVIMQFAASLVKGQGRIARKTKNSKDFNRRSAEESFRSLVKTHDKYGWVTPPLADG
ncbi:UNVERIFIED_CONTAM: hypothetical protein PYX00_006214 [Menopon gallinae]|uniref:E2 ubiquitin-conjugating enzyme n=1 Tax=Menopon gallinae TaxID=328185 RepID=A0AAW2HVU1_9NEOP